MITVFNDTQNRCLQLTDQFVLSYLNCSPNNLVSTRIKLSTEGERRTEQDWAAILAAAKAHSLVTFSCNPPRHGMWHKVAIFDHTNVYDCAEERILSIEHWAASFDLLDQQFSCLFAHRVKKLKKTRRSKRQKL